jgi:hypothetical protein
MDLKNLVIDNKSAWVDYPEIEGFEVCINALSRKQWGQMRREHTTQKLDRATRQKIDVLDEERFNESFVREVIKDWKGLKMKHIPKLMLADIGDADPEADVEFSFDNALTLVTSSVDFDQWVNEEVFNLDNFRS